MEIAEPSYVTDVLDFTLIETNPTGTWKRDIIINYDN